MSWSLLCFWSGFAHWHHLGIGYWSLSGAYRDNPLSRCLKDRSWFYGSKNWDFSRRCCGCAMLLKGQMEKKYQLSHVHKAGSVQTWVFSLCCPQGHLKPALEQGLVSTLRGDKAWRTGKTSAVTYCNSLCGWHHIPDPAPSLSAFGR